MTTLWTDTRTSAWHAALASYNEVVAGQGVARLPELDAWYHGPLPAALERRTPVHLTADELVRLTEWKMARGVWRAPNLVLVRGNDAAQVEQVSAEAFAQVPHESAPVATLATLAGVGPATASAAVAAFAPATYPFFDELVAAQVPSLGKVAWTLPYYRRYAAALRERASMLGDAWTAAQVERALWAHVGGKAALPVTAA
jgi:hypothetical protein